MITADRVRELLNYDPDTGMFTWIKKASRKIVVGKIAGCKTKAGYIVIGIDGVIYYAHQLAWLWMTGETAPQIDHEKGDRIDNRWNRLREATHQQNVFNSKLAKNSTSGFKGVSWHKRAGKWSAQYNINGRKKHLGLFENADDAHAAYISAVRAIHPEFVRAS